MVSSPLVAPGADRMKRRCARPDSDSRLEVTLLRLHATLGCQASASFEKLKGVS
jgi:hypothetical protein